MHDQARRSPAKRGRAWNPIREVIEAVATELEPDWQTLQSRIHFVPMSARELETAVATEVTLGISIEDQLTEYPKYREQVKRIDRWDSADMPVFPQHLEEFLQVNYGQGRRIVNPLGHDVWNAFCDFCQRRIFDEGIDVADKELFEITQRLAYDLWERRGSPLWDDLHDWHEAERIVPEDRRLVGSSA